MDLKLNSEKCRQRKRLAARRDGVNSALMKFLPEVPAPETCARAKGTMPRSLNEAMAKINSSPYVKEPLKSQDVHIHYAEAANDNFLNDRYMFMGANTLKNIATAAEKGIAFMNSHATGGMSAPAELPYGRTFAGRYEEVIQADGSVRRRALIGVYMLRGVHPNGAFGPSTDDLHAAIQGGTLFDVSVGLYGGEAICDVCAGDLQTCGHVPGTTHEMNGEQVDAQAQRGVPAGRASYTYENGLCHEVSAVYDGAVPGAGFSKALASVGALNETELEELREAFATLLGDTFELKKKEPAMPMPEEEEDDKEQKAADGDAEEVSDDMDEKEAEASEDESEPPMSDEEKPESAVEIEIEDEEEGDEGEGEGDGESEDEDEDEADASPVAVALVDALVENTELRKQLRSFEVSKVVANFAGRLTEAQKTALSPLADFAVEYGGVAILEAFLAATPNIEAVFGKQVPTVPAKIDPLPISRKIDTASFSLAHEIGGRLEARGVKRGSKEWEHEYLIETQKFYKEQAAIK